MPEGGSVTHWIEALKRGDDQAARKLWERYFQQMVQASRNRLRRLQRRAADEEDVALSAFDSLCRGAEQGRFPRLDNRDDLWPILLTLTAQKAVDMIRHETRQRRGSGNVRGDSVFAESDGETGLDRFANKQPTPEFLALVDEQYSELMARLRDDTLRRIVQWKLEGYANEEIARLLGVSLRTVGRKLGVVREIWVRDLSE